LATDLALSHSGHPAATFSPSRLFRNLRRRKHCDAAATATTAFPGSFASSFTFPTADDEVRREDTGSTTGCDSHSSSTLSQSMPNESGHLCEGAGGGRGRRRIWASALVLEVLQEAVAVGILGAAGVGGERLEVGGGGSAGGVFRANLEVVGGGDVSRELENV
jgi:hypothetical protein